MRHILSKNSRIYPFYLLGKPWDEVSADQNPNIGVVHKIIQFSADKCGRDETEMILVVLK